MANVHDVAALVLDKLGAMSTMKLQKIVYYCQCWHLAREDKELFDEPIEAWKEGPVVKALYVRHRQMFQVETWAGDPSMLSDAEHETVEWVCEQYGGFSAEELSQMTHKELPWMLARRALPMAARSNEKLSAAVMSNFYARQLASAESSVLHATANAAIEGIDLGQEWVERLRDVAAGSMSADELIAEEVARLSHG